MVFECTVESKLSIIYLEKLSLEVREVSKNVTKTLPNIANPHMGIYRGNWSTGFSVYRDGQTHTHTHTHTQTDFIELYIRLACDTRSIAQ